jgi:hypothetical protein
VPGGGEARPRGQLIDRRRRSRGDADERYDSQSRLQMSPTTWRRARGRRHSTAAPAPPHATGSPQDDLALAMAFPLDAVVEKTASASGPFLGKARAVREVRGRSRIRGGSLGTR